jgi:uncharacterized membrane protein YkvA (DUF1232 family)
MPIARSPANRVAKPADSPDRFPLPSRYLEQAARPETVATLADRLPGKLRQIADGKLIALVKEAYGYATDPRVPTRYKVMAVATLLYFISPLDAVSDFIPGLGYLDDAAVLAAFLASVRSAVKEVVSHTRQETEAVVTHAISEAREAWARRGVSQVCLSLWAATTAASVGLLYVGAKTAVFPGAGGPALADPFLWACVLAGLFGITHHVIFAYRLWRQYSEAPPEIREPLAYAIVSLADWRQILILTVPVLVLALVLVLRATLRVS